jgi:Nucleotidyltransferase/DNA polymerase involved in DNA repair
VARTVALKLRHDDFRTVTRRHTFEIATDLDAELYGAARDLFRAAFEEVRVRNRGRAAHRHRGHQPGGGGGSGPVRAGRTAAAA